MPRFTVRLVTLLALAVAALATAACGKDPASPSRFAGLYVLPGSTTGGALEPTADTLILAANGTGARSWHVGFPPVPSSSAPLSWRVGGDRILITYSCPIDALTSCIAGPHASGTLRGTTLTLTSLLKSISPPLPEVFRRASGAD